MKSDKTKIANRIMSTRRFARKAKIADRYWRRMMETTATITEVNTWLGSSREMMISNGIASIPEFSAVFAWTLDQHSLK